MALILRRRPRRRRGVRGLRWAACVAAGLLAVTMAAAGPGVAGASPAHGAAARAGDTAGIGDASIVYDPSSGTWAIQTSGIRKTVRLAGGTFQMTSLVNRLTGHSLLQGGHEGAEFSVGFDSAVYTGAAPGWVLDSQSITTGSQSSVNLAIVLHQGPVRVTARYTVHPASDVIEQSFDYRNVSGAAVTVHDPEILDTDVMSADMAAGQVVRYRFTGAVDYLADGYDDSDRVVREVPDAESVTTQTTPWYGSSTNYPEVVWTDPATNDGLDIGWSYAGEWSSVLSGSGRQQVDAYGINNYSLAPGEDLPMPLVHVLAVRGSSLDDAGNALKDFQYRYKWDYTNPAYTNEVRSGVGGVVGSSMNNQELFQYEQAFADVGATVDHLDLGWSVPGTFQQLPRLDMAGLNTMASKNNMKMLVWYPLWDQPADWPPAAQNPDWVRGPYGPCTNSSIFGPVKVKMENSAAVAELLSELHTAAQSWGPFEWRQDGGGGVFTTSTPTNQAAASQNYLQMMADFLKQNPGSSINLNECGGEELNVETLRMADLVQTTDTQGGHYSVSTLAYLFPPDKLNGEALDTFSPTGGYTGQLPAWNATQTQLIAQLGDTIQWVGIPADLAQLAPVRNLADIYRYMIAQGVAGRWSHMFHPRQTGDPTDPGEWSGPDADASYYLQRMNNAGTKGVIIPLHDYDAGTGYVTLYPKGLSPAVRYTMRDMNTGTAQTRTGAWWMAHGIARHSWGGDLIWINIAGYPGAPDSQPPAAPSSAVMHTATYMGTPGVEVTWAPGHDNNWISWYEVFRNGVSIGTRPTSRQFFDPSGTLSDTYQVRTVDGAGNTSALTTAVPG